MFHKLLIANRGEIALRILRTCREMDIETVGVYSTEDKDSLHIQFCNEAICIGGPRPEQSYLHMENIITAAIETKCDAIHTGFGFLSENSTFANLCQEHGIVFIGPSGYVIQQMGNKATARALMIEHGVPVVPGSEGCVTSYEQALEVAKKMGFPILIKASAGGGGRGMRKVFLEEELEHLFHTAKSEALSCFGNDEMYVEKLIINPKHIEFQILADHYGNIIHLGERDCSIQRKNQKLIEESPSKNLSDELRTAMGLDAIKAARAARYTNAGTIEFILDASGKYYFIEMNTRIQVEHPVTEMRTGIDLIKEQIRISAGIRLKYSQDDILFTGHCMECRINAEDPWNEFRPNAGEITFLHLPGGAGVRVDTLLYQGYRTSPFYDSMMAKIIVHGATRLETIRKMRRALEETVIDGIQTNTQLSHLILHHKDFVKGNYHTGFMEEHMDFFKKTHYQLDNSFK
ncbi:MAG: acetyl-CoA carboxylase biotin carboxylase subunit [Eubacteriales bacterium]